MVKSCAMMFFTTLLPFISICTIGSFAEESNDNCCTPIKLTSGGGADFYQKELLGSYGLISQLNGKPVYGQINGKYYLYWLPIGVWTVGSDVGSQDSSGIRFVGQEACPEACKDEWEYWSEWRSEWVEDWSLEVHCVDDGPTVSPLEPCATGSLCDGCSNWAEMDGIKYCCAKDCNSGSISVHTEDGDVICECRH